MRITHIGLIGLVWIVTLALVPAWGFAQTTSKGKNGDVQFRTAVRVGAALLPPGHYRFQHQVANGEHNLVVRKLEEPRAWLQAGFYEVGAEVSRVPCTMTEATEKNKKTEMQTRQDADSTVVMTQIKIAGEKEIHIIGSQP